MINRYGTKYKKSQNMGLTEQGAAKQMTTSNTDSERKYWIQHEYLVLLQHSHSVLGTNVS